MLTPQQLDQFARVPKQASLNSKDLHLSHCMYCQSTNKLGYFRVELEWVYILCDNCSKARRLTPLNTQEVFYLKTIL